MSIYFKDDYLIQSKLSYLHRARSNVRCPVGVIDNKTGVSALNFLNVLGKGIVNGDADTSLQARIVCRYLRRLGEVYRVGLLAITKHYNVASRLVLDVEPIVALVREVEGDILILYIFLSAQNRIAVRCL